LIPPFDLLSPKSLSQRPPVFPRKDSSIPSPPCCEWLFLSDFALSSSILFVPFTHALTATLFFPVLLRYFPPVFPCTMFSFVFCGYGPWFSLFILVWTMTSFSFSPRPSPTQGRFQCTLRALFDALFLPRPEIQAFQLGFLPTSVESLVQLRKTDRFPPKRSVGPLNVIFSTYHVVSLLAPTSLP